MIILDTHIWVWWIAGDPQLTPALAARVKENESAGLGVSIISCWEVAKKVQLGRLELDRPVSNWIDAALAYPGVHLVALTPRIAVESTQLPGEFHRDPADQMIVATARVLDCPLLTADERIKHYPHVRLLKE